MEMLKPITNLYRLFVFFLAGIVLLSCNTTDQSSSIDLTENQSVSVFDVFSEVQVIKLETTEDNLITDIRRIEYFNSRYYILDERSQQIFCFDEEGNFVFKINSQGRGQGEYHYITDISIDEKNNQLVVLDPVVQRIHFFDLSGNYLISRDVKTEKVMGLIRVYPLEDSILLFTSFSKELLQFYSLNEEKMIYADFSYDVASTLHAFDPMDNVFFYDDKVLFFVPLSREIVDVSQMIPQPYITWCFGVHNNSEQQINRLIEEINIKEQKSESIMLPYEVVGQGRILNHQIMKSFENNRFRIVAMEFDDNFKFVIQDKMGQHNLVFSSFKEGIRFPFQSMHPDRSIVYYQPEIGPREIEMMESRGLLEYFFGRNWTLYTPDILQENGRQIIENHNPMTDNPFLVVYKFRE